MNGQTHLKIIDFGIATTFTRAGMTSKEGSSMYMAPEVVRGGAPYSEKCDLWSLGILLYVILTGYMPFMSKDVETVYKLILAGDIDLRPLKLHFLSSETLDFLNFLLCKDPDLRISAQ